MKWQLLFFMPSIVGFHFDTIRRKWQALKPKQRVITRSSVYGATLITLGISIITTFHSYLLPATLNEAFSAIFVIEAMSPLRVLVAGLWFMALAFLFSKIAHTVNIYTKGVVEYFGTHSLTAYIVHGYIICLVNIVFPIDVPSIFQIPYYTAIGFVTLLLVYGTIRIPFVKRIIPR
jgi:hypothetical protein